MLTSVESDIERANLLRKVFKLLCDLKSMYFFGDLVTSVQTILINNIEKCNDLDSKEILRNGIESLVVHLPDTESKTLFTQTLNKLTASNE